MQADSNGEGNYNISTRADILALAGVQGQLVAAEMASLREFAALQPNLGTVTILSTASLPDANFIERYRASDAFAPEPRLYATATYEAMAWAIAALLTGLSRAEAAAYLTEHYPRDLPTLAYHFDDNGKLLPVDTVIEQG
jgi:hypothetical protein